MATIIKKPSVLVDRPVYYTGDRNWTEDRSKAVQMHLAEADALMNNPDGKNGGWTGATTETV